MRILVTQAFTEKSQELIEQLQLQGHNVWAIDWRYPEKRLSNFYKINPLNFELLDLFMKIFRFDEVHNIVSSSYLANFHILLSAHKVPKVICYFEEQSKFLDKIAKIISEELGFSYESRHL